MSTASVSVIAILSTCRTTKPQTQNVNYIIQLANKLSTTRSDIRLVKTLSHIAQTVEMPKE